MSYNPLQKAKVTVNCDNAEQAEEFAQKHMDHRGVIEVSVMGKMIIFLIEVAGDMVLSTFGKIKDSMPWLQNSRYSCTPIGT